MAGLATIVSKMADGSGEREMVEVHEVIKEPDYSSRMSTRKRGKVGVKDARVHWRQYASISDVVSAFSASTKRRQLSEAEAKHGSALKLQAAWRGAQGQVTPPARSQHASTFSSPVAAPSQLGVRKAAEEIDKVMGAVMAAAKFQLKHRGKVGVEDESAAASTHVVRASWRRSTSASLVASALAASRRRRLRSEAEAKHMSALKVQAAWRGVRGRVAAMDERIAKIEMLAADSEASERSYSGNSLSSLLLGFSAPHGESSASNISMAQKLPPPRSFDANEPPAPNTEREDRSPIPSNRPRNEVKEVQMAEDHGLKSARVKAEGKAKALRQEMLSLEALSA